MIKELKNKTGKLIHKHIKYQCPECDEDDAIQCCKNSKIRKCVGYKCNCCDTIHDNEDEALYCCDQDNFEEIERHECLKCKEEYEDEEEAFECCEDDDD